MKQITLKRVQAGSSFWFGNVRFEKVVDNDDELTQCKIYETEKTVYIAEHALVDVPTWEN